MTDKPVDGKLMKEVNTIGAKVIQAGATHPSGSSTSQANTPTKIAHQQVGDQFGYQTHVDYLHACRPSGRARGMMVTPDELCVHQAHHYIFCR
jgi:hypothetical protein